MSIAALQEEIRTANRDPNLAAGTRWLLSGNHKELEARVSDIREGRRPPASARGGSKEKRSASSAGGAPLAEIIRLTALNIITEEEWYKVIQDEAQVNQYLHEVVNRIRLVRGLSEDGDNIERLRYVIYMKITSQLLHLVTEHTSEALISRKLPPTTKDEIVQFVGQTFLLASQHVDLELAFENIGVILASKGLSPMPLARYRELAAHLTMVSPLNVSSSVSAVSSGITHPRDNPTNIFKVAEQRLKEGVKSLVLHPGLKMYWSIDDLLYRTKSHHADQTGSYVKIKAKGEGISFDALVEALFSLLLWLDHGGDGANWKHRLPAFAELFMEPELQTIVGDRGYFTVPAAELIAQLSMNAFGVLQTNAVEGVSLRAATFDEPAFLAEVQAARRGKTGAREPSGGASPPVSPADVASGPPPSNPGTGGTPGGGSHEEDSDDRIKRVIQAHTHINQRNSKGAYIWETDPFTHGNNTVLAYTEQKRDDGTPYYVGVAGVHETQRTKRGDTNTTHFAFGCANRERLDELVERAKTLVAFPKGGLDQAEFLFPSDKEIKVAEVLGPLQNAIFAHCIVLTVTDCTRDWFAHRRFRVSATTAAQLNRKIRDVIDLDSEFADLRGFFDELRGGMVDNSGRAVSREDNVLKAKGVVEEEGEVEEEEEEGDTSPESLGAASAPLDVAETEGGAEEVVGAVKERVGWHANIAKAVFQISLRPSCRPTEEMRDGKRNEDFIQRWVAKHPATIGSAKVGLWAARECPGIAATSDLAARVKLCANWDSCSSPEELIIEEHDVLMEFKTRFSVEKLRVAREAQVAIRFNPDDAYFRVVDIGTPLFCQCVGDWEHTLQILHQAWVACQNYVVYVVATASPTVIYALAVFIPNETLDKYGRSMTIISEPLSPFKALHESLASLSSLGACEEIFEAMWDMYGPDFPPELYVRVVSHLPEAMAVAQSVKKDSRFPATPVRVYKAGLARYYNFFHDGEDNIGKLVSPVWHAVQGLGVWDLMGKNTMHFLLIPFALAHQLARIWEASEIRRKNDDAKKRSFSLKRFYETMERSKGMPHHCFLTGQLMLQPRTPASASSAWEGIEGGVERVDFRGAGTTGISPSHAGIVSVNELQRRSLASAKEVLRAKGILSPKYEEGSQRWNGVTISEVIEAANALTALSDTKRDRRAFFAEGDGRALRLADFVTHRSVIGLEKLRCVVCNDGRNRDGRRTSKKCVVCNIPLCDLCWSGFHQDRVLPSVEVASARSSLTDNVE